MEIVAAKRFGNQLHNFSELGVCDAQNIASSSGLKVSGLEKGSACELRWTNRDGKDLLQTVSLTIEIIGVCENQLIE